MGNYIQNGKIRKIYNQGRVYIPQEDIEALYMSKTQDLAPSREEFSQLKEDVKRLERAVELLKSGLGFGARKPQKTEADLLMFRHTIMNELSRPGWSAKKMMEIADELVCIREEDIELLCKTKGDRAWIPMFDLVRRMLRYVEANNSYPSNGMDVLHSRLLTAQERVYGLIYSATKLPTELPYDRANVLLDQVKIRPGAIEKFIAGFIATNAQK